MRKSQSDSATAAPSLRGLVLRGASWKLFSQIAIQVGRIGFVLLLARLLTPTDFGLIAMALVVTGFVIGFSDLGLGAALVQREIIDERDRSTVFWTGVGAGALLTVAGIALAAPLAQFYGEPAVRGLMAALSLSFIVTALGATQRALMTKDMNFRTLELSTIAGVYVGGAGGVMAASAGWGAWALVVQQLTIAVVSTTVVWFASPWRPHLTFSSASLRSLGGYGGNVLGTRLTYYAQESALPLIIGRSLGSEALGVFTIAYAVVLAPLRRLAIPLGEVLFPAFARLQHDPERMSDAWVRALRILASLCVPAMLGVIVVAPDLVPLVLGDQWVDAIPIVQILAFVGLLQTLTAWNGSILMGLGRANTLFRATVVFLVVYVLAFLVGAQWGILGIAVAYAIVDPVLEAVYTWLTTHALGIAFSKPLRALSGIAEAAFGMVLATVVLRAGLVEADVAPALRLVIIVGTGIAVYVVLFAWRAPEVIADVSRLRKRLVR